MRFFRVAALAGCAALAGGCAGGQASDGAASTDSSALRVVSGNTGTIDGSPVASAAPAPPTGEIHEVKMTGDGLGYRYVPDTITVQPGDGLRFVMQSGGPHNVRFDPATTPADQRAQLFANMPNAVEPGTSPMLMNPNEAWELSLANIKPGTYSFFCTPHLSFDMVGAIVVKD